MTHSLPSSLFQDESTHSTAGLKEELWRDCLAWSGRVLDFVTRNRGDLKLSANQVAMLIVFGNPRFSGMALDAVAEAVEIPLPEIEAAILTVRGSLFGRSGVRRGSCGPVAG